MMKKLFKTKKVFVLAGLSAALILASCSDDFLDRTPEDAYNVDDFYQTEAEVEAAANHLYSRPWYSFVSNVSWGIGELASGNARTWDARNSEFQTFAITGEHGTLTQAWESLYAVIAQANSVINTLPEKVSPNVSEEVVNNSIAEARMIRATAYFYLVRIFGSVPILEDNTKYVLEPVVPRNRVEDIYEFIKRDLQFAVENLHDRTETSQYEVGRVDSNSAKAMLAKIHLYQENWSMAYQLANEVINSGAFSLMEEYNDLFLVENDNNVESVFALQWTDSGVYSEGNSIQSFFGSSGISGFADGWSALGPSISLQDAYEDDDERFYGTIMAPGAVYPNLNGGYTVPENVNFQGTNVGIKKYVVGKVGGGMMSYPNNTYIMRYAEVLLIKAEAAIMGGGPVEEGLKALNKVRDRAGLEDLESYDLEDVFHERRIELALEGEFWYDVIRRGPEFSIPFLAAQEKGTFDNSTTPATVASEKFTPILADLLFPYPSNEIQNNPALLEPPVPFDFGDEN
ncbi:RagB/SusD family nutrient uptake outer membrane protein [Salinimicrobium sp. TH3]|uniref:RagB/SusD family nutrient uptake outer membrane protein n=1 Tax=Salinimicrobium sp. TH3 TaxID=2997342 RepID=UPI0022768272|nr:RagB/SusD family nutrient uptake outer membrane protein [Salinimicrobium sp. TH3]MCY2685539.1 RagB/SusD family nutrient uptake outer membrane protein [Salinimicrobium sp. TH3]